MASYKDADKESYLLQLVSKWGELKARHFTEENIKLVTTILIHMTEMQSFGLMAQFIETLEDIFVAELRRCPQTFFCLTKMKLHFNQFTAVYDMIKNVGAEMQGQGEALIQLWNATLYKEAEVVRGKELNSVKKFRLRNRKPPPVHVCPNGARPTNSLPRHATVTLWRWALQHAYRLYPTKDERFWLEQQAGLTAYQVKTWFANVRRRIKKCGVRTILEKKKAKYDITEDIIFKEPPKKFPSQLSDKPVRPMDLVKGSKELAESVFRLDRPTWSQHTTTPGLYTCTTPIWDSCPRKMSAPDGRVPEMAPDVSKRYSSTPSHVDSSNSFFRSYNQHNNDRPASQRSNMFSTETPVPTVLTSQTNVYQPTSLHDRYSCVVEELARTATPQLSEKVVRSTQPFTAFRQEAYPTYDLCKWPANPGVPTDRFTVPDLPQCVPDRVCELNTPSYVPDYHPLTHVNLNHSSYTPLEIYPIGPCYTTQTYKNPFPLPMMSRDPLATLLGSETPTYCLPTFGRDVHQGHYQTAPQPSSYSMNSLCSSFGCNLNHSFSSSNAGFTEPLSRPVSQSVSIAKHSPEKKTLVTARMTSWSYDGESTIREGLSCPPPVQPNLTKGCETRTDLYGLSVTAEGGLEVSATLHKAGPDSGSSITRPGQYDMLRYMLQHGTSQYRPYTSIDHSNSSSKTLKVTTHDSNSRTQHMKTSPMHYVDTRKSPLNYIKPSSASQHRVSQRIRRQHQKGNRVNYTSGSSHTGGIPEVITITSSPDNTHVPSTTTGSSHSMETVGMVSVSGQFRHPPELLLAYTSEQSTNTSPTLSGISSPPQVSSLSGYLLNPDRLTSSVREQLLQATLLIDSQTQTSRAREPPLIQPAARNEQLMDNSQTLTSPTGGLILSSRTMSTSTQELLPRPPAEVLFTSDFTSGRQVSERGGILHLSPQANQRALNTLSCSTVSQQRECTQCSSQSADRPPAAAAALWPHVLNKDSLSGVSLSGHNTIITTNTAVADGGSVWQSTPFSPRLPVKDPCAVVSGEGVSELGASGWPCIPSVSTSLPLLPPTPQWTPASPPAAMVGAYNTAKAGTRAAAADTRGGGVVNGVPPYRNLHLAHPPYPTPRRDSLGSSSRSSLTSEPASLSPHTQPDEQEVVEALLHLSNYSMPSLPEQVFYTSTAGPQYNT